MEVIKEQDSKAYDKLSRLWEENVTQNESDLKEKLAIISELLTNYIVDMENYITPEDSGTMVRVDRHKAASERTVRYSGSYRSEYI